jgi:hypothetical protein
MIFSMTDYPQRAPGPDTKFWACGIYNVLGQEIRELVDRVLPAGTHTATWDGKDDFGRSAASGVYFYRLEAGRFVQTRKLVLVR